MYIRDTRSVYRFQTRRSRRTEVMVLVGVVAAAAAVVIIAVMVVVNHRHIYVSTLSDAFVMSTAHRVCSKEKHLPVVAPTMTVYLGVDQLI